MDLVNILVHFSVDACFYFLAIMNNIGMHIHVKVLGGHMLLFLLVKYVGVELMAHTVFLCLTS